MVDSNDTKYYPTQFLFNTDSFGFLISESGEEHNYQKAKEGSMNKLISEPSKNIDFDRAKQFHCELCQKDWKTWKSLRDHISQLHSDIQGELKDFPLKINGRYEKIVKFVYRKKSNKYVCELCQKDWESMNDLEKHLKENHAGVKGKLKIDVAYGKTIIRYDTTTFVKNLDKDCGTISIGLDEPIVVKNDPGKVQIF